MSIVHPGQITMSGKFENLMVNTKVMNLGFFVENQSNLLLDLAQMAAILDFATI